MRLNSGIVRYTGTYVERHFQKPHVASYTYKKLASRTLLRFSSVVAPFFLPIWHCFSDALPVVPRGRRILYTKFSQTCWSWYWGKFVACWTGHSLRNALSDWTLDLCPARWLHHATSCLGSWWQSLGALYPCVLVSLNALNAQHG